jgi:hypothetical protein
LESCVQRDETAVGVFQILACLGELQTRPLQVALPLPKQLKRVG